MCILIKRFVYLEDTIKQEPKDQSSREWISPVPEVEVGGSAAGGPYVRARKDIPRGARFGPFLGKWASEPFNPRYAWEVSRISLAIYMAVRMGTRVCVCFYRFLPLSNSRAEAIEAIVKRIGRCSISSD